MTFLLGILTVFILHYSHWHWYYVTSGSMAPAIPVGSLIITKPEAADQIWVGDIITFQDPRSPSPFIVTHRVVSVVRQGPTIRFLTRGDANNTPDLNEVESTNVIGVVKIIFPLSFGLPKVTTHAYFSSQITANGNIISVPALEVADPYADWQKAGDVEILTQSDGFIPYAAGKTFVKIGRTTNEGKQYSQNTFSKSFPNGVGSLHFAHNIFSYDYRGFDAPGFVVKANDTIIFQQTAADVDRDPPQSDATTLDSTGWQTETLLTPEFQNVPTTITFMAGNDEDNLSAVPATQNHQTWVYLDEIKVEK